MKKLSTYFTFFVAIYVILDRYASPIPKVTLSETFLCLFWGLFFIFRPKRIKIEMSLLSFCVYLLGYIIMPFTGLITTPLDMVDAVGTPARLLFLYFSIAVLGKNLFDIEKGIQYIRWIAIVLAGYACLQIIAARFGVYLTTYIPFLPIMSSYSIDEEILTKAGYGLVFRPCSLLTEPAALCIYLLCALTLELFSSSHKYQYVNACLFSAVCMLSRSSTGIMITILIWGLFFIKHPPISIKQFSIGFIVSTIGSVLAALLVYFSGIWNYFLERTFGENRFGDFSSSTRFYAIKEMLAASDSVSGVLFGQGLSNLENYLPGFARAYLNLGLIGLLIIMGILFRIYIKGDFLQRKILFLFIVLNIGTEIVLGPFALLFLCLAIGNVPQNSQNRGSTTCCL